MATPEVFPFASIGESSGGRYPDWIRALRKRNGVYLIRERRSGKVIYIGESHSERLYATLTRHFQRWSDKYNTAGVTYDREAVDVAVIVVPQSHAAYLQNELICEFDPRDNRLICDQIFEYVEDEQGRDPPRGYDYDVNLLIHGIFYQFTDEDADDDLPF
jgi:excinuclease UvrABC nuclease subunit